MSKIKKIGVLTSGGDAPGMNACVRAVVRTADAFEMEAVGFEQGFRGVLDMQYRQLGIRSVGDIIHRGGTFLKTARCEDFKVKEFQAKGADNIRRLGIEGMVVCGGDGSFMGAKVLSELGIPTIALPATIDNDMPYTDYAIGFITTVNTVVDSINRIRDTGHSHDRIFIVEVMGRRKGDIAIHAGLAAGAEYIITPEVEWSPDDVVERIRLSERNGKLASIIVAAEGAFKYLTPEEIELRKEHSGKAYCSSMEELEQYIYNVMKRDVRSTRLGHVQRGGSPCATDRNMASQMGYHAVKLLNDGIGNRAVGMKNDKLIDMDIIEALGQTRPFNRELYELAFLLAR